MNTIKTEQDLTQGIEALIEADDRFATIFEKTGMPSLRRSEAGFSGVLRIIAGQQVSKASAAAIWQRMQYVLSPLEPGHLETLTEDKFREAGLSGPKIRAVNSLTSAVSGGDLDFSRLEQFNDNDVIDALVGVKGIGPWSAEVYLLSCLGRRDAWPNGDLALQIATQDAFRLNDRPNPKAMAAMAETWRPWRSIAARLLWAYYALALKRQDQGL